MPYNRGNQTRSGGPGRSVRRCRPYVLNNRNVVKDATRRKVLEAIEQPGYRPNKTARS